VRHAILVRGSYTLSHRHICTPGILPMEKRLDGTFPFLEQFKPASRLPLALEVSLSSHVTQIRLILHLQNHRLLSPLLPASILSSIEKPIIIDRLLIAVFHDGSNYRPPPSPEIYSQAALCCRRQGSISLMRRHVVFSWFSSSHPCRACHVRKPSLRKPIRTRYAITESNHLPHSCVGLGVLE
jgi:hypothetical protein